MFNQVSADGFFAAADGGLDWVVQDPEVQRDGIAGMPRTGTVLFGRKTYEMFAATWPKVLEAGKGDDPHGGRGGPEMLAFAEFLTEVPKIVFSKTLDKPSWKNTRVLRELEPHAIAAMKQDSGKDMLVMGSASIVEQLTEHGLIDQYSFMVSPILLGQGRTLFREGKRTKLTLMSSKAFPSGCLILRYARA
ncbi:MAG TPA: dihydrofolate reductase family protein [Kofleriaceae bacterium]